jgi:hypothetical protein
MIEIKAIASILAKPLLHEYLGLATMRLGWA